MRYDLQWFRAVDPANNVPYDVYLPLVVLLTVVLLLLNRREGAYDAYRPRTFFDECYAVVNSTTTSIMLMIVIASFIGRLFYSRMIFIYAGLLIIFLLSLVRLLRTMIMTRLRQVGVGVDRILIVGAGEVGRAVIRNLIAQPELGYRVVGFLDDDPVEGCTDIGPIKALGPVDLVASVVKQLSIDQVIITLPWQYHHKILRLITECEQSGVRPRGCLISSSSAWAASMWKPSMVFL